jgi:enamine deaminase RidA (YjgF/YER057c/UK114 family)
MTLELINPPDLPMPSTYTQVVVATGSRLVFVAGQEPEDVEGASSVPATSLSRPGRRSPTSARR